MSKAKLAITVLILVTILALSLAAGYTLGLKNQSTREPGLDVVAQAWNIILTNHVDKDKLNTTKLSRAAIKGIVAELDDPHTTYLSPEENKLGLSSLEGRFGGIGAQVAVKDKKLTIIAPIPGSPAAKAGIKPGDIILKIGDRSTADMSLAEAVLAIRGPAGTSVKIVIQHQGETEPVEIEIVRAEIDLPSVRFEMKGDIAHIYIAYFSGRTDTELTPVLESLSQQVATGIILDLRSNPGGVLETVIDVASHFIAEGAVVSVRDSQGRFTVRNTKPGKQVIDLPMIVLTDNYSASGSEVLAGALQDHSRAIVAGTRTYGKGSVNTVHTLKDGSGLYVTIARWLTPNGRLIEGGGLAPDTELKLTGDDAINWAIDQLHSRR